MALKKAQGKNSLTNLDEDSIGGLGLRQYFYLLPQDYGSRSEEIIGKNKNMKGYGAILHYNRGLKMLKRNWIGF